MRRRGSGSISKTREGRFRAQLNVDDRKRSLGVHPTWEEADAILAAAALDLNDGDHRDGVTLAAWGEVVLDRRELQGLRGVERERSRWAVHVAGAELASLPVRAIVRADVQRWLDRVLVSRARGARKSHKPIARQTASNVLTLLRAVLEDAMARGIAEVNAARDVVLPRSRGRTRDAWTYLTQSEQERLLQVVPGHARPLVAFAISAGLRQGEQWALELADVHHDDAAPHVVVRYGAPGQATKSGKPRRVDLMPGAVRAVREQLELLAGRANPYKILFPSLRGSRRQPGAPTGWEAWIGSAELGRTVRWHDLRHTCASSLVAGWWGRAWTLIEVCALLGHSSIKVTERYAHLAGTITEEAVRATPVAVPESPRESTPSRKVARLKRRLRMRNRSGSHLRDLNSRPTVYEGEGDRSDPVGITLQSARARALRGLELADAGDPRALAVLVELAGDVVEATEEREREAVG